MLELNRASGPWDPQASGRRVGRAFLGRLVFGTFPFDALRSGRLAKGAGPGPKAQGTHTPQK